MNITAFLAYNKYYLALVNHLPNITKRAGIPG